MDIYLTGASVDKLFSEISCGDVGVQGVSVIVSSNQYDLVITKLESLDMTKWSNKDALCRFLSYRCDKEFLRRYIDKYPKFISGLSVNAYIYANSDIDVLVRLHEFNLLPETERLRAIASIRELAVDIPDSGFLRENIRSFITDNELSNILLFVQEDLLPNLDRQIEKWRDNYNGDDEPEIYFEELKSALDGYKQEVDENETSSQQINEAIEGIDQVIEELRSEYSQNSADDDIFGKKNEQESFSGDTRSVFDDVDA